MKKYLIVIIILPCLVFAQRYDQKWLLGSSYASPEWGMSELTFGNNSLVIDSQNYPISLYATQTCMYDNQGDLMFATNGIHIWNKNMDTMVNGKGLSPSDYTNSMINRGLNIPQGVIALPSPKQNNRYYLFHETVKWTDTTGLTPLELYYSMIDMNGDNGKGEVKAKNTIIIQDTLIQGQLTACKHANGRDWWIVVPTYFGDGYYRCLLTTEGVQNPIFQATNAVHIRSSYLGQAVFSPDGTKYVRYDQGTPLDTLAFLRVFDFDRCTGLLNNEQIITIPHLSNWWGAAGAAISPNSKVVYINDSYNMYQYDLTATDIGSTQYLLGTFDGHQSPFNSSFFQGQLAPDGKIYWSCTNGSDILHVIDYPDSLGAACSFRQHGIQLPAYARFGLPNHPNYYLGAMVGSACDTLTSISNLIEIANIYAYPNPTKDIFFVGGNHLGNGAVLSLCNSMGQEVYHHTWENTQVETAISMAAFPQGVYYLRISVGDAFFTEKLIKE